MTKVGVMGSFQFDKKSARVSYDTLALINYILYLNAVNAYNQGLIEILDIFRNF